MGLTEPLRATGEGGVHFATESDSVATLLVCIISDEQRLQRRLKRQRRRLLGDVATYMVPPAHGSMIFLVCANRMATLRTQTLAQQLACHSEG